MERTDGRDPKDCNFLLVGWINVQGGHHHSILKDEPESYYLHSGIATVKNSVTRSCLKEIKLFLRSLVRGLEMTKIQK